MFQAPIERTAFYIGNYPVMKYGIVMGTALAVSIFFLSKIRKNIYSEFSEETVSNLTFWIILGGISGARLWYVLLSSEYFFLNPVEIIMLHHGGISIQGAIMGGIITGFIYAKRNNLNFFKLADMYSLVLPIGQAIGRWGNFFNSEAFGKPCEMFWKLYIPVNNRPVEYVDFEFFHPTFLYESIGNLLIFLILFFLLKDKLKKYDGCIFFCYLILYSVLRFFIEFMRTDSVLNILGIPIAVIVCIIFAFAGVVGISLKIKQ